MPKGTARHSAVLGKSCSPTSSASLHHASPSFLKLPISSFFVSVRQSPFTPPALTRRDCRDPEHLVSQMGERGILVISPSQHPASRGSDRQRSGEEGSSQGRCSRREHRFNHRGK